jgi:hypothetical protein
VRRFRIVMATAGLVAAGLSAAGCDTLPGGWACTALYAYGVSAEVTDADTGAAIGNAVLKLYDGKYEETMQNYFENTHVGAGERAGTYKLVASAPGYETQTIEDIVVTADECHVKGVAVAVKLRASGEP